MASIVVTMTTATIVNVTVLQVNVNWENLNKINNWTKVWIKNWLLIHTEES